MVKLDTDWGCTAKRHIYDDKKYDSICCGLMLKHSMPATTKPQLCRCLFTLPLTATPNSVFRMGEDSQDFSNELNQLMSKSYVSVDCNKAVMYSGYAFKRNAASNAATSANVTSECMYKFGEFGGDAL